MMAMLWHLDAATTSPRLPAQRSELAELRIKHSVSDGVCTI
jgi:hypothetical protein